MAAPTQMGPLLPSEDELILPRRGFRLVLVLGFAGMLALITIVGVHSISTLRSTERSMAASDQLFLRKNQALESLRSAFYLYGSEFRRFLANPDREETDSIIFRLKTLQTEIESNLEAYAIGLNYEERAALEDLRRNVARYTASIQPVFSWTEAERRARATTFLAWEAAEQRVHILQITDKISSINERRYRSASERSGQLMESIRWQVLVILIAAVSLGLLLASSVVIYVLRLERTLRARYEQIVVAQGELHKLSAKLVSAQEEERRSIARELHDEVGQTLTALLVDLGNAVALASADNHELKQRLLSVRALAQNAVNAVRNMSLLLRPSMLDDFGLVPALNWQARELSRRTGMRVEVSAEDLPDNLSDEQRTCVYRLVQEALHNAAIHAQARIVRVVVRQEPERLLVVIQDDGRGFDTRKSRGMGLLGMEERVRYLGGTIQIRSEPGRGTLIEVQLPLTEGKSPLDRILPNSLP